MKKKTTSHPKYVTEVVFEKSMKSVDERFNKLDHKIDKVEHRLDTKIDLVEKRLNDKIDAVEKRLDAKIDGVEKRLDAKITNVAIELLNVKDKVQSIEENMVTKKEFNALIDRMDGYLALHRVTDMEQKTQAFQIKELTEISHQHEERITRLESNPS